MKQCSRRNRAGTTSISDQLSQPTGSGTIFHQDSTSRGTECSSAGGYLPTRSLPDGSLPELIRETAVHTIDRWIHDWYGLHLHSDRPEWQRLPAVAINAAAHAAGFITALDLTDSVLAAQLATNRHSSIDRSVWYLGTARDLAWQAITALATSAHRHGCTSLPTGPNPWWKPVLVRDADVSRKAYPALRNDVDPDLPPRFTAKTVEHIGLDLSHQPDQRIRLTFTADVLTVSFGGPTNTRSTCHEPDADGLYTISAGSSLRWQPVDVHGHGGHDDTYPDRPRQPDGGGAAGSPGSPRPIGTRCACRSARDARDPRGHNHQLHTHGRCFCACHGRR